MDAESIKELTNSIIRVVDTETKPLDVRIEKLANDLNDAYQKISLHKQSEKQLEAQNKILREAMESIKANSYPGLAVKESTLLNGIYITSTNALRSI